MATKRDTDSWPKIVKEGFAQVKVYRVKAQTNASGFGYVVSFTEAGKRKLAKFADQTKALAEARRKVGQLASGQHQAAGLSIEDAQLLRAILDVCGETPPLAAIKEWADASRICGGRLIEAAQLLAEHESGAATSRTVAQVIIEFRTAREAAGINLEKTYRSYLWHLRDSALGGKCIRDVDTRSLTDWMVFRYENPIYRNTALQKFRAMWNWARGVGYLPQGRDTAADGVPEAKEPSRHIGIISASDLRRVLKLTWETPELKGYMVPLVLSAFCGLRTDEACNQDWSTIYLDERKSMRVTKAKPNTPANRLVPLCPAAVAWLKLCGHKKSGPVVQNKTAIEYIRHAAKQAKIPQPRNCYRHSYISHAVAKTGNVDQVALDAGTSRAKVFAHYRQLVLPSDGEAWFASTPASALQAGAVAS